MLLSIVIPTLPCVTCLLLRPTELQATYKGSKPQTSWEPKASPESQGLYRKPRPTSEPALHLIHSP